MGMGGTPQGTIQVRRRGLVVARCGIGAADSFGMKQCPGGCPISGIAVLVDRQGLHGPVASDADHVAGAGHGSRNGGSWSGGPCLDDVHVHRTRRVDNASKIKAGTFEEVA
jgi:hypothetical protein